MLKNTQPLQKSLRYVRPYWMLHLQGADNWRIYEVIQEPHHARVEMMYQSWLGGLDRPYSRPRCTAFQPVWLEKKRHEMEVPRLQGAATELELYFLEWHNQFDSFGGKRRPTAEDLNTAFDLVARPLDLSYACKLIDVCRNRYKVQLSKDSFTIFLEACLRVDRLDVAQYALENAEDLGFWHVDPNVVKFVKGEQEWYQAPGEVPVTGAGGDAGVQLGMEAAEKEAAVSGETAEAEEDEEARLLREIEEEEKRLEAELANLGSEK